MKIKGHNFIIPVIFLSFGVSCVYSEMTHMSNDELRWLQSYEKGDTIYFHSNKGNVDTLIITNVNENNSMSPFVRNEASFQYVANGSYEYQLYHNGNIFEGILLLVEKRIEDKPVVVSFSLGGLYSDPITSITTNVLENGEYLDDCIIIDNTNSHKGKFQKNLDIIEIIWSKTKGILRYETNEERYFLVP